MNTVIKKAIAVCGGQVPLAKKANLSQAAIHKLLTGKSIDMRVSTAKKLSEASGIPISEFLS